MSNLIEKIKKVPTVMFERWHRRKQKTQIISNQVMKKIYFDFFKLHEERETLMLHRPDLYSPGPPITVPSYEMLDLIDKHAGKSILDIGCGHGVYGRELVKKGYTYTGIEANEKYVEEASKHVDVRLMRAEKLDFPSKSVDTVIMFEVLEHLEDPYAALEEIVRVARKNMIITVPNIGPMVDCVEFNVVMHHFMESTHVNFFTGSMLSRFLKKYFPYVKIEEFGQFFNLSGSKLYYHLAAVASFEKLSPGQGRRRKRKK